MTFKCKLSRAVERRVGSPAVSGHPFSGVRAALCPRVCCVVPPTLLPAFPATSPPFPSPPSKTSRSTGLPPRGGSVPWELLCLILGVGRGSCPVQHPLICPALGGGQDRALRPLPRPGPCSDDDGRCKKLLLTALVKAWVHHYVLVQKVHVTEDNNAFPKRLEVAEATARPSAGPAPQGERPQQLPTAWCRMPGARGGCWSVRSCWRDALLCLHLAGVSRQLLLLAYYFNPPPLLLALEI